MKFGQQKYWLKALIKNPGIAKWYSHWKASLNGQRSPLSDELPWVTYDAINWLSSHLTKKMNLFEWGSGGSTMFFAKRVKQVVTVEHDPVWYQDVVAALGERDYKNVLLNLVEPVPSENIDPWYTTTDLRYANCSFEQYIRMIDVYADGFFDVVVVDGRARPGCMKHAITKIKDGGYLLLDNSERAEYQKGWDLVEKWKNVKFWGLGPYNNSPWETRIWQKDRR